MNQVDYKKELKEFFVVPKNKIAIIDVPPSPHFLISGTGDPNTSTRFRNAIQALFSVSYTLKFAIKNEGKLDYKVMPLSGYWTLADPAVPDPENRDNWAWSIGIQQPEIVDRDRFIGACETVRRKKDLALIDELRFEIVTDGLCAQILHIGPFADEPGSFARLNTFVAESGYRVTDQGHREIYLSDVTKTAPERLKTILRKKIAKL